MISVTEVDDDRQGPEDTSYIPEGQSRRQRDEYQIEGVKVPSRHGMGCGSVNQ